MTASQTRTKRKRGGQKGNRNACKHGFYSGSLSPPERSQLWNITSLEGVDPEIAFIRVKLQSSLQHGPGNRRLIREASRLIVKWYSEDYGLDRTDRNYLKAVVEDLLETASMQQSAGLQGSQKQMADDETNRVYFDNRIGHPTYEKEHLNLGKTRDFGETNPSQLHRISPPAPMTRKDDWQTDETNRGILATDSAGGNCLAYEKESSSSWNTSHAYETNHRSFPPMTDNQVSSVCFRLDAGRRVLA